MKYIIAMKDDNAIINNPSEANIVDTKGTDYQTIRCKAAGT